MRGTASTSTKVIAVAGAAVLMAGCSGGLKSGSGGSSKVIKIGYVSPQTGPLAPFGEADSFVVAQMKTYFKDHPIKAGGKKYSVDIIVKDAQSDSKRAGEVAADLINKDGVDLMLASSTPDIVNPVADQCEANKVPCITTVAPWQPYVFGRGGSPTKPFTWTYHFFWGLEDVESVYQDMWSKIDSNKKVAAIWPNDPDGTAWRGDFPKNVSKNGFTIDDPGLYPDGTQDYSAQISTFKKNGDDLLVGVPIPPDFTTFWKQAKQQGYTPKLATIGKALLFPSSIEALGDSGINLGSEVWWSPSSPFKSSLTGQSAKDLAAAYESSTGKEWTQPIGFVHALFEVAAAAIEKAGGKDKTKVADALKSLTVDTIVGHLAWGSGPTPNVAKTPLVGGQWRKSPAGSKFPYELVIVSNKDHPEIPTGGSVEPLP